MDDRSPSASVTPYAAAFADRHLERLFELHFQGRVTYAGTRRQPILHGKIPVAELGWVIERAWVLGRWVPRLLYYEELTNPPAHVELISWRRYDD